MVRRTVIAIACSFCLLADDLSSRGAEAMRTGRFAEAESVYRELAKQSPNEAGWHGNLGLALYSQKKFRESAESLERSLKLRPSAGLSNVLGIVYLKLGKPCEAISPLRKAEKPDVLADALSGCKRYPEAAKLYERIGNTRAAGRAYWQARDYSSAKRIFSAITNQYSSDVEFSYEYGDTLLRLEGASAALPFLERATTLLPGRGALGKAYVELGRYRDAVPHLEAASAVDSDLLLPLSRAYKETGRAAEAERALKLYREKVSAQN